MYMNWERFAQKRYEEFFKEIKEGIVGKTVVIRKRSLDKIGLWDERVQVADFDLYLRVKKRELEYNDIKPVHICLDTFIHHYIRLTTYSNSPKFVDAENLISIKDRWGEFIKYFPK